MVANNLSRNTLFYPKKEDYGVNRGNRYLRIALWRFLGKRKPFLKFAPGKIWFDFGQNSYEKIFFPTGCVNAALPVCSHGKSVARSGKVRTGKEGGTGSLPDTGEWGWRNGQDCTTMSIGKGETPDSPGLSGKWQGKRYVNGKYRPLCTYRKEEEATG